MSFQEALRRAREFITAQGGELAPQMISEEELNPHATDDLTHRAYPIEPIGHCYNVNYTFPEDSNCSEFTFFEDGKQRTVPIGYINVRGSSHQIILPVHFYVVASVILKREGKELKVWDEPLIEKGVFVEKSMVPDQRILRDFESLGLSIVDTEAEGADYYDLRRRALQEAKKRRLDVEDRIIRKWRMSPEATEKFLVVDGTLMNFRNEQNVEQCIGVSKSFGSRYFEVSQHNRIMEMAEFQRSWTFRFHSEDETDDLRLGARERISWYLRLRSRPHSDPEFGLVRVELSRKHAERAVELADRFSRSLLSERLPTAYPSPRWDKHLYPIQSCENYLASVMPSMATISASMKG